MAEERDERRAGAQGRPSGKGTGKVTAGHGRRPRGGTKRGGAAQGDARRTRADADARRRRQGGSSEAEMRASATAERQRRNGDTAQDMHPPGASGGQAPAPTGRPETAFGPEGRHDRMSEPGEQRQQTPTAEGRSDRPDGGIGPEEAEGAALHAVEGMQSTRVRERRRLSERMGRSTRLRLWLQSSALDFALVLVVSVALAYTVSYGFYSAEAHRGNIALLAGVAAPLLLVLFAGSWSKKAVLLSAAGTVVLCGAYIGAAVSLSPDSALFAGGGVNDVAGNYTIFAIVLCVTVIVTYLLSRRTAGLVFLLVFGVLACGIVQFLWREWIPDLAGIPAFLAVFLGTGMLFVYQCYRQSVYSANRVKRTSFLGAFGYSALIGVVCVAVAAGVFAAVEAVAPGTIEFKPFETHVSPPLDELSNDYEKKDDDSDDSSDETNESERETSETGEGGEDSGVGGLGLLQNTFVYDAALSMAGYDPDDPDQNIDNIAFLIVTWELAITGVLLCLLALGIVLFWRYRRTLRLKRLAGKTPEYQAWYLYTFLIERFRRLKLAKPEHLTPLEFAVGFSKPMLPFTRGTGGVDFVDVSSLYQDAALGGRKLRGDELNDIHTYYRAFFKNARSYVGWPKWVLWKFWRI